MEATASVETSSAPVGPAAGGWDLGPLSDEARGSMALRQSLGTAVDALQANKLRATLTMLGIVIGVAAVIVIVALGEGARQSVEERLSGLGTNTLTIFPSFGSANGVRTGVGGLPSLSEGDAQAIQRQIPGIAGLTPSLPIGNVQVVAGSQNWNTRIGGAYPSVFKIQSWTIAAGAAFDDQDEASAALVCDLGQTVATNLFGSTDPIGKTVLIRNIPFKVKGVLTTKGSDSASDRDDTILIPFSAAKARLFNLPFVGSIVVQVAQTQDIALVQQQIAELLRLRHHLPSGKSDVVVFNNNELLQTAQQTTATLALLLTGVASISLLVGGIGIMNIMLVSVTERTREIGIRLAVGARKNNILSQFLIECVLLSGLGGIVGIGLGCVVALLLNGVGDLKPVISPQAIVTSFAVATLVGIFFGFYPARKAANLDPIEALRYE